MISRSPVIRIVVSFAAAALLSCRTAPVSTSSVQAVSAPASAASWKTWEPDIAAFEASDRVSPPKPASVLFVGSSSIRVWPSLQSDFPGVAVIQRGFGGSELGDVVHFVPRIVIPYRPRLIVLYAGDNDLAAGKSAETVVSEYREFVRVVHQALPSTRIAFVSIKPSGSRVALLPQMRLANEMIRKYAESHPGLAYVDVFTPMLGPDGAPREDLFSQDRLHMNARGYELWTRILDPVLRDTAQVAPAIR